MSRVMNEPEMLYGHQLSPALCREALAAYVHRYTAEHVPSWSRTPAPNGRHYAPQYRSDSEWLDRTRFPITRSGQGIRLKSGSTIYCDSNDPSWPYGQWLDRPFNRQTPPQGNNGNDSNNDHGPDGTVPPSSPQHPAPTTATTEVGTGTTQQLNPIPTENTMDKLELIEHAQRFAPEGTTARVYNVKTDGDKPTDYKGVIVSIHEGQALQKLNERGSFVVHQADNLTVGDMVQITYDAGLRSIAPYAPSAALAADAHAATPEGNPKPAKPARAVKPKATRTPKAKVAKKDATPVTTTVDSTPGDATPVADGTAESVEPVQPVKTMDGITNDLYRQAAERIVAAIDAGTSIWQKPWKGAANGSRPHNAQSGLNYSGMNRVLLTFDMVDKETADARYMTYKQIQAMARDMAKSGIAEKDLPHVMKGAKGLPIYKMGFIEKKMPVLDSAGKPKLDADGKAVTRIVKGRSYLQSYVVFHASNITNLAPLPDAEEQPQWERAAAIEELIDQLGVPVKCEAQNRAYYSPSADTITMPERSQFVDTLDQNGVVLEDARGKYYAVLLHESSHATGHVSRIGRDLTGRPGDGSYAYEKEELIGETSGFFLVQNLLGIGANSETIKRTAAYLESWKSLILDDPKALFAAFSAAEKAADWVMQKHPIQLEAAVRLASETASMGHTMDGVSPTVIAAIQTVDSVRGDPMDPWAAPGVGQGSDPHTHAHSGFGMSQ